MKRFTVPGRLPDGLDAMSFLNGLVFFAPVSLLVRTRAGVDVSRFFLLQAALSGTVLLGEVPSGRLADRMGCRRTLILCQGCFLLARVLLLAAFLCRSFPLFVLEAVVEGAAVSLESGTLSSYLYGILSPEEYLPRAARAENWETAGFLASTLGYAGLYALGDIPLLLGASALTSLLAWLASFTLPAVAEQRRPPRSETAPRPGLARLVLTRRALALIAALSALSMGRLLVNFFYADKLLACGIRAEWMSPLILGYSAVQMLAQRILARLQSRQYTRALGLFSALGGGGMLALGLVDRAGPALLLMLVLPLLLRVPGCILAYLQNRMVDAAGWQDRRAAVLAVDRLRGGVLEVGGLAGSAAAAAAGPAACFALVGLGLAAAGWAAAKILD